MSDKTNPVNPFDEVLSTGTNITTPTKITDCAVTTFSISAVLRIHVECHQHLILQFQPVYNKQSFRVQNIFLGRNLNGNNSHVMEKQTYQRETLAVSLPLIDLPIATTIIRSLAVIVFGSTRRQCLFSVSEIERA